MNVLTSNTLIVISKSWEEVVEEYQRIPSVRATRIRHAIAAALRQDPDSLLALPNDDTYTFGISDPTGTMEQENFAAHQIGFRLGHTICGLHVVGNSGRFDFHVETLDAIVSAFPTSKVAA